MAVGDVTGVVMDEEINNAQIVDSGASTVDDAIAEIESGKSIFQLFGSIKKAFLGCITTSKLANNLATTLEGFALDAKQGKVLKDSIDVLNTNLTIQNGFPTVLENGWTLNWDFFKMTKQANRVNLNAIIIPGNLALGTRIMTLPEGFRPIGKNVAIHAYSVSSSNTPGGLLYLQADGQLLINGEAALPNASMYAINASWDTV